MSSGSSWSLCGTARQQASCSCRPVDPRGWYIGPETWSVTRLYERFTPETYVIAVEEQMVTGVICGAIDDGVV